jgi:hypothetical protein
VEPLQILVLALIFVVAIWSVTLGRRWIAPYFMSRDPSREQREHEVWMGGAADGYVPKPELGPSPRDRLRSPPEDDH